MELTKFLKILFKHKFTLIAIPLITVIITYFLVRQLPKVYISKARIATGLVDQSKQVLNLQDILMESRTNQEFSNLLQMIQLKKVYDQVSYLLILHDLTSSKLLRKTSPLMRDLNKDAIRHAIEVYTRLYNKKEALVMSDPDQRGLNQVLVSMGYDENSLKKKTAVYRVNNSDYVDIEFQSENPELSAFVANHLCSEFIAYYTTSLKANQLLAVASLDSLQKQKKVLADSKIAALKDYKVRNRILNIDEQAKILYTQISDYETKYDLVNKDIEAYTGAIKDIDNKFNPSDRKYLESASTKINQDILATTTLLKIVQNQYVRDSGNEGYKKQIDSLKAILSRQINESTDKYLVNPLATKDNLVIQKINLQVSLDLARYSVNTLRQEMTNLNKRFDTLVSRGANLGIYNSEIEQANKEYLEALNKFNQASFASDFSIDLKQIEYAIPGSASPSKMIVLVILSGIISFFFCLVTLFLLFYLDYHIRTVHGLVARTGLPVLGTLPNISKAILDLRKIWSSDESNPSDEEYKTMMRSLRFEVDAAMGDRKKLVITSFSSGEGKTFVTLGLAYAYARTNKKVLIIDGNFNNPGISETMHPPYFLEDIIPGKVATDSFVEEKNITVLANRGNTISLFELLDEQPLRQYLQYLEGLFDLILIEACELSQQGKIKEWISVSDHVLAVFESDQTIPQDKKDDIEYLHTLGDKYIGWVLNRVTTGRTKGRKM